MKLEKLSKNIWHSHPVEETDRPILAGICGEDMTLIIDAGNSKQHFEFFQSALAEKGVPKRNAVVLTHWHWDHVFGAAYATGPVISHRITREIMKVLKTYEWTDEALEERVRLGTEIEFCRSCILKELPSPREVKIRVPEIEVEDRLVIDLGTTVCMIEHIGSEHAQDHLVVYSEADQVLFVGDILFVELYDGEWYWTPQKVDALIERLLAYPAKWFVASHVYPVQTREEFLEECNWIQWVGHVVEAAESFEAAKEKIHCEAPGRVEEALEMATWFQAGLDKEKG